MSVRLLHYSTLSYSLGNYLNNLEDVEQEGYNVSETLIWKFSCRKDRET